MEVTHGLALLFAVVFAVIATIFRKMLWWLMVVGYCLVLSIMAITNNWEVLFFPVLAMLGLISIIGFIFSAVKGDII